MICSGKKKSTHEIGLLIERVMNVSDLKMYLYLIGINIASLLKYLDIAPFKLFSDSESIVAIM